jgi:ribA/ribD-fused uncharacterized protein
MSNCLLHETRPTPVKSPRPEECSCPEVINSFRGDWAFLSNFAECEIYLDGHIYPSVEHAFQAAKTADEPARLLIRTATDAKDAKRLGKMVNLRDDWEEVKDSIMREFLSQKFSQGMARAVLFSTGERTLVEGNYWHDQYWGICYCKKHAHEPGRNQLGNLLMELRTSLRTRR